MGRYKNSAKVFACVLFAAGTVSTAHATSQLLPGISTGLPLGLPLSPGVYSVTQANYGWRGSDPTVGVGVGIPTWLIWSTPWTLFGGRFLLDTVTAIADVDIKGYHSYTGVGNTYVDAQLKWNLGGGLSAGVQSGVFLPVHNDLTALGVTRNFYSLMEIAAVTYEKNGWEIDATGIYGTGRNGDTLGENAAPQWANFDLTAFKRIGKWEVGAVGFGSHDLSTPVTGYQRQSQFAAGGLVGYQLGKNTLQLKVTRDLAESNYTGRETRVWLNLIIPTWTQK
jgi:hypothetical protein